MRKPLALCFIATLFLSTTTFAQDRFRPHSKQSGSGIEWTHREVIDLKRLLNRQDVDQGYKDKKLVTLATRLVSMYLFDRALEVLNLVGSDEYSVEIELIRHHVGLLNYFRGLLTRIEPYAEITGNSEKYAYLLSRNSNSSHQSELFLLDGPKDIATSRDISEFLRGFLSRVLSFRNFIDDNKLALMGSDLVVQRAYSYDCSSTMSSRQVLTIECVLGGYTADRTFRFTPSDVYFLQQKLASFGVYAVLINAYDTSKAVNALFDITNESPKSNEGIFAFQFSKYFKTSGDLVNPQLLNLIPQLGLDFVEAYKWARSQREELCSDSMEKNGQGVFVSGKEFCIEDSGENAFFQDPVDGVLDLFSQVFTSNLSADLSVKDVADRPFTTKTDLSKLWTNPAQNISSYLYSETYLACQITSYSLEALPGTYSIPIRAAYDNTAHGVLPGGEYGTILNLNADAKNICEPN